VYCVIEELVMQKLVNFIAISIFATSAVAADWEDPEARFDATKNFTSKSTIEWVLTKDVQTTCDRESKRRGLGGFDYAVLACSFWQGSTCIIFTKPTTTLHEIGHEMRHCFQGNYH